MKNPVFSFFTGWQSTFISFRYRDFRLLWLGTVLMMGGFQMQMVVQGFLVYDMTGSVRMLGIVTGGVSLSMLSMTLLGGAIADRVQRKPIIQVGQGFSAVIAIVVAVSISTGTVTWVYLLLASVLQGVTFAFMGPARQAIVPQLVGEDRITNALSLNSAGMASTALFAPGIGGILYALIGPEWVYYVMTVMWLTAATLTTGIRNVREMVSVTETRILKDISDGLVYIFKNTSTRLFLGIMLATVLLSMPLQSLLPVYVIDVYARGPESLGLLVSMIGLGSVLGSLVIAFNGSRRRGLLLIVGGYISSAALLMVSLVPIYFVAIGIMVLVGIGNIGPMGLITAIIMERTDKQYRGRMMSIVMTMWGLMPLGVIPLSVLADAVGVRVSVGFMAVSMFVVFSVVLISQRRIRDIH